MFCLIATVFVERCTELFPIWSNMVLEIRKNVSSRLGWESCDDPSWVVFV